ncbi:hypothetical protein Ddc_04745 [Ditylenchus destructor]|nr:hypothetical protein Ddc_04745 [Ditylenchus destructor]
MAFSAREVAQKYRRHKQNENPAEGKGIAELYAPLPPKNSVEGIALQKKNIRAYSSERLISVENFANSDKQSVGCANTSSKISRTKLANQKNMIKSSVMNRTIETDVPSIDSHSKSAANKVRSTTPNKAMRKLDESTSKTAICSTTPNITIDGTGQSSGTHKGSGSEPIRDKSRISKRSSAAPESIPTKATRIKTPDKAAHPTTANKNVHQPTTSDSHKECDASDNGTSRSLPDEYLNELVRYGPKIEEHFALCADKTKILENIVTELQKNIEDTNLARKARFLNSDKYFKNNVYSGLRFPAGYWLSLALIFMAPDKPGIVKSSRRKKKKSRLPPPDIPTSTPTANLTDLQREERKNEGEEEFSNSRGSSLRSTASKSPSSPASPSSRERSSPFSYKEDVRTFDAGFLRTISETSASLNYNVSPTSDKSFELYLKDARQIRTPHPKVLHAKTNDLATPISLDDRFISNADHMIFSKIDHASFCDFTQAAEIPSFKGVAPLKKRGDEIREQQELIKEVLASAVDEFFACSNDDVTLTIQIQRQYDRPTLNVVLNKSESPDTSSASESSVCRLCTIDKTNENSEDSTVSDSILEQHCPYHKHRNDLSSTTSGTSLATDTFLSDCSRSRHVNYKARNQYDVGQLVEKRNIPVFHNIIQFLCNYVISFVLPSLRRIWNKDNKSDRQRSKSDDSQTMFEKERRSRK